METFALPNHPGNPELGKREVPFTKELWIDRSDFALVPPPKFFRLKPEGEVRLMGAYIVNAVTLSQMIPETLQKFTAQPIWNPDAVCLLTDER